MSLSLSGDVARRLGHTAEAMLSPLRWPTLDAWWREVETRMQGLVPGSNAMFTVFDGERPRHLSNGVDDSTRRQLAAFTSVDADGQLNLACKATASWLRHRRATRQAVWGEATNIRDLAALGFGLSDALWYHEGLVPAGLKGYVCMTTEIEAREAVLCWSIERGDRWSMQQAEGMTLLQILHPAMQAGHHAFASLAARQAAVVSTLDGVSDALMVMGPDGRERHRNTALRQLLAAEPERERVLDAMRAAAGALSAARDASSPALLLLASTGTATGERPLVTTQARYALRATYGSEALWGVPGVVLVTLEREAVAPARIARPDGAAHDLGASAPSAAVLASLGFTAREAEVAQLLARRLSNAELSATLGVSAHTARHHTERVMQKLGVRKRGEVVSALLARWPA
ncbi:MAG: response regulator transcription factor [Gemmatirosa sp.]